MFVTKKRHEQEIKDLAAQVRDLTWRVKDLEVGATFRIGEYKPTPFSNSDTRPKIALADVVRSLVNHLNMELFHSPQQIGVREKPCGNTPT